MAPAPDKFAILSFLDELQATSISKEAAYKSTFFIFFFLSILVQDYCIIVTNRLSNCYDMVNIPSENRFYLYYSND